MKKHLLFSLFTLLFSVCYAQEEKNVLKLTILDNLTNEGIDMALIGIYRSGDKEAFRYTLSDRKGRVLMSKVPMGSFQVKIEHTSFNAILFDVKIEDKITDMGNIKMVKKVISIDDVVIESEQPISIKGDTTTFNAKYFNPAPTDYLEDLIIKMPGLEIRDGTIFYNGKRISELTVEGKRFFSNDQTVALQNLPAYAIKKIKVFKKKNMRGEYEGAEMGYSEENAPSQLDIELKDDMKTGWIGNMLAGHDIEDKYRAKALAGKFGKVAQYAIVGEANNVSLTTGPSTFYMPNLMTNNTSAFGTPAFSGTTSAGMVENMTFGADYSRIDITDFLTNVFNGNYSFKRSNTDAYQATNRETYLPQDIHYQDKVNKSSNITNSNTLSFFEQYMLRKKGFSIDFTPNFGYNTNRSFHENSYTTKSKNETVPLNEGVSSTKINGDDFALAGNMKLFQSKFLGKGTVGVDINYAYQELTSKSANFSKTSYLIDKIKTDSTTNQLITEVSNSLTLSTLVNYGIGYTKRKHYFNIFYKVRIEKNNTDKTAYSINPVSEQYNIIDSTGTGIIHNSFIEHSIGFRNQFRLVKNWTFVVGFEVLPSLIKNRYGDNTTSQWNYNYAPKLELRKVDNLKKDIRLSYNGMTKQPTINQLQPIVDKTNPLNIRTGNPNLSPEFINTLNFSYKMSLTSELSLMATLTQNKIIYKTTIDSLGIRRTNPDNENGVYSANLSYRTSTRGVSKLRFTNKTMLSFNRNAGYSNSEKYFSSTCTISEQINASYRLDYLYTNVGLNINYSNYWYTLESMNRKSNWTNSILADINWSMPLQFNLISKFRYTFYFGYQYNNKPSAIWDMELAKQLYKTKLILSVKAYDLLNQTKNLKIIYGDDYMEEQINNTLKRYFMINLIWKFGKFGK